MMKTKTALAIFLIILVFGGCKDRTKEENLVVRKPDELFLEFVAPTVPTLTYAFDCRETIISAKEKSRWVAFDMLIEDWEQLKENQKLELGNYYLGRVGTTIPADTGFQGYLDNEYSTWLGKKGAVYFSRPLDKSFVRVVFFKRDT